MPFDFIGDLGRERDDALRRLAARLLLQLAARHLEDRHALCVGEFLDVLDDRCRVDVTRHPDLAHLAAAGDQQLTDGLTTLHLLAAETLVLHRRLRALAVVDHAAGSARAHGLRRACRAARGTAVAPATG